MFEDKKIYINGEMVDWANAQVHVLSHGLCRGSSIFEVTSIHNTIDGPAVFRLDESVNRFYRSAELTYVDLPISKEELHSAVLKTVKENNVKDGIVKIIACYDDAELDLVPAQAKPSIYIAALDIKLRNTPLSACINDRRKLHPDTVPVEAKAAANYLNSSLSRMEAIKKGYDRGIMLDLDGFVAECGVESVLFVKDNILYAPVFGTVLKGISRSSIFEVATSLDIKTDQKRIKPDEFMQSDEIIISSTGGKLQPVKKINDRVMDQVPGPVTLKLQNAFNEILAGKNPDFAKWLFTVQ